MKKIGVIFAVILVLVPPVFAHPPRNVVLEYDIGEKILSIEIEHVSTDINDHFIRRIIIQKNDEEPIKKHYNRQETHNIFTKEIPFYADSGDRIRVELFCSKGGTYQEEITVR